MAYLLGVGEEPMWSLREEGDLTQRTQRSELREHREERRRRPPRKAAATKAAERARCNVPLQG